MPALMLAGSVHAQLCLSSKNQSYVVKCYLGKLEGESSANRWDLSGVKVDLVSTLNYQRSREGAGSEYFPATSHFMNAKDEALCTYLSLSEKTVQYLGFSLATGKCVYDDPWNLYSLPLRVGDKWEDNFSYRSEINLPDQMVSSIGEGFYSYVVEDAGTLITPLGVFLNVFRIRCKTVGTDSTYNATGDYPPMNAYVSEKVVWVSMQDGMLREVACTYDEEEYFFSQVSVSMPAKIESSLPELVVFPDPATDRINISLPEDDWSDAVVSLFDSRGNLVLREQAGSLAFPFVLGISRLRPGYYQIRVSSGDRELKASFIKI